ncbi:DEKNAAC101769 [Brettanomyces naardenensis]|uniref:DEKNAAC101769 n=1 Tax=Brettanomyces naardenensis TaxID=13370 RepID=A0A448YIM5_BRENA|nr:DEKNAAC101769 [Brettanomyces naardenensis]
MLGLYDIYNGRNNSGWVLSGIGLRMGFNLGFQLNPKSWYLKEESINDLTVSIRSRIYWGCFIVDHLLGLLLGRPATLQISDTTIQESEATPDIDWIAEYNFPGYDKIIDISNPLKNVVQLIVLTEDILHRVFFKKDPNLDTYNRQIIDWREKLPDPLKWDRKTLGRRASDPTRMMLVYYYYIVQLCLNRQFVRIPGNSSQEICHNATEDLYIAITSFTKVHGFQKCSILIVYASIISVSVILLGASEKAASNDVALSLHFNPETRRNFFAFMNVLKECSNTWKLSQRSFEMICQKLKKDYRIDYEKEYERQTSEITSIGKAPSYDSPGLKSQHSDIQYNSFGGPPLFVSTDFDWESLFPGCKDENE